MIRKEKNLFKAIKNNNIIDVKKIIGCGVNVNIKNRHGHTPLTFAATKGYMEIVKTLLGAGANDILKPVVKLLQEAEVNAKVAAKIDTTPLEIAVLSKYQDVKSIAKSDTLDISNKTLRNVEKLLSYKDEYIG